MIKIIIVIAGLLAGLILGPEISANKGYILLSFDGYTTYEVTVINAFLIALIVYFALLLLEWLLRKLFSMSSITRGWFGQRKTRKAQKNSLLGMLALFEGNSKQAQKLLAQSAPRSEAPALTYIAAAKAAHQQRDYDLRDEHFRQACNSQKNCQLAAGLVWVELQVEAKQYENALATLDELDKKFPKNKRVSELYFSIYPAVREWQKYLLLLDTRRKFLAFNDVELATLQFDAYQELFKQLAEQSGEDLQGYWDKKIARALRKELIYQKALLNAYLAAGYGKFAELFLLDKLRKQFTPALLPYLNKLEISDYYPLILLLDKKLKKESEKGLIHQALAKLKLKENQTLAAINHLKESLKSIPNINDFALLADLLEKDDRTAEAQEYYRQGLQLAISKK